MQRLNNIHVYLGQGLHCSQVTDYACFSVVCYFFFKTTLNFSGIPSKGQTVWIQIKPDILSCLIWVQLICKGYQRPTLVSRQIYAITAKISRAGPNMTMVFKRLIITDVYNYNWSFAHCKRLLRQDASVYLSHLQATKAQKMGMCTRTVSPCADPEGGGGVGVWTPPLENHKLYGFLWKLAFGTPHPAKVPGSAHAPTSYRNTVGKSPQSLRPYHPRSCKFS